jgi:hypothetical protein
LLAILIFWEALQFLTRIFTREAEKYFTLQNIFEVLMFSLSTAFFLIEFLAMKEKDRCQRNHQIKEHLLGWALFLAWIDLTMLLGKFDRYGRHIYR